MLTYVLARALERAVRWSVGAFALAETLSQLRNTGMLVSLYVVFLGLTPFVVAFSDVISWAELSSIVEPMLESSEGSKAEPLNQQNPYTSGSQVKEDEILVMDTAELATMRKSTPSTRSVASRLVRHEVDVH